MSGIEDIRDMPAADLNAEVDELRKEICELRMRLHTDASALAEFRKAKKRLAQVLTVRNELKTKASQAS